MGGNPGVVGKLRSTGFGLGNASREEKTIREGCGIFIHVPQLHWKLERTKGGGGTELNYIENVA